MGAITMMGVTQTKHKQAFVGGNFTICWTHLGCTIDKKKSDHIHKILRGMAREWIRNIQMFLGTGELQLRIIHAKLNDLGVESIVGLVDISTWSCP